MDEAEQHSYEDASFECPSCQAVNTYNYTEVTSLLSEQPIPCTQCQVALRLKEEDLVELSARFDKAARMGKLLVLIGLPFFLISAILVFMYGFVASLGSLAVGMMIFAFANMNKQSSSHTVYRLTEAPQAELCAEASQ